MPVSRRVVAPVPGSRPGFGHGSGVLVSVWNPTVARAPDRASVPGLSMDPIVGRSAHPPGTTLSAPALALVSRYTFGSNTTSSGRTGSPYHSPLESATPSLAPDARAEVPFRHELDNLPAKDRIRVGQARQRAVEKALAQARERPGGGGLECRRPVPVDVAGADRSVEQGLGLQRPDDPPAERVVGARVTGSEIDDFEPVILLPPRERHEAIAGPTLHPWLLPPHP